MSTRAHPREEWITVPVPRWSPRSSSTWSPGGWPPTSEPPAQLFPPLPAARAGQLQGLPAELQRGHRTATRYRYYRCRGKLAQVSSGRASCCPARFIPVTQLDELVWADLCAVLQHPELVVQALQRAHGGAWVPQELRRRHATLRSVRASVARQRLLAAYLAGTVGLEVNFKPRELAR